MPRAVGIAQHEKFDLKSLPGAYVVIRRMNQGEKMRRQGLMSGMKVRGGRGRDFEGELLLANQRVVEFEFAVCIIDHNLEDENDEKLDLANPSHLAKLDGKVGDEIGTYINKVNQFEEEDSGLGEASTGSDQLSL